MSHVVRVDSQVYDMLIRAQALLSVATGHTVSFSDAVLFIMRVREIAGAEA